MVSYTVIFIVLLLVAAIAFFVLKGGGGGGIGGGRRGNAVLLIGPMGAGKTSWFFRMLLGNAKPLEGKPPPHTVTSQVANEEMVRVPGVAKHPRGVQLKVVDLPGHDSQWPGALERMGEAIGVIFMVDSAKPEIGVAGQKLFDVMSDVGMKRRGVPIMLVCNKKDKQDARGVEDIKEELLEDLRDRTEMKDTIEDTEGNVYVKTLVDSKKAGRGPFEFEHSACPVEFASVSVMKNDDLDTIYNFCASAYRHSRS